MDNDEYRFAYEILKELQAIRKLLENTNSPGYSGAYKFPEKVYSTELKGFWNIDKETK